MQKYHGLSGDTTGEQILDRTSFKNFPGLRIGDGLPDAGDQSVLADSACHSEAHEQVLLEINAQDFLMRKATTHHHLSNLVHNMDRYACLVR